MLLSQDDPIEHALPERVVQGRLLAPTAQGVASALLADAWFNGRHLNFLKIAIGGGPGSAHREPDPQVLARSHEHLCALLRPGDALSYLGEGRYLALVPNLASITDAALAAGRLIDSLSADPPVEVNIGIARYPEDASELTALLEHAALALDLSCESGANCFSFAECSLNGSIDCGPLMWDEALSTGDEAVDAQHRDLVVHMNAISSQLRAQAPVAQLHDALARLLNEMREHFSCEERLMERMRLANAGAHRQAHQIALEHARWLANAEPRQAVGLVARYCFDWIHHHAGTFDLELALARDGDGQ